MQSSAVVSEPTPNASEHGERTGASYPGAYLSGREGAPFGQPRPVPPRRARPRRQASDMRPGPETSEDEQLDDLMFSWRRLTDPRLRKLAIQIIRSMAA